MLLYKCELPPVNIIRVRGKGPAPPMERDRHKGWKEKTNSALFRKTNLNFLKYTYPNSSPKDTLSKRIPMADPPFYKGSWKGGLKS